MREENPPNRGVTRSLVSMTRLEENPPNRGVTRSLVSVTRREENPPNWGVTRSLVSVTRSEENPPNWGVTHSRVVRPVYTKKILVKRRLKNTHHVTHSHASVMRADEKTPPKRGGYTLSRNLTCR